MNWTEEKLQTWARAYYQAHKSRYHQRLDMARAIILDALEKVPAEQCYVAWSGGKDSTVLAHLVNSERDIDLAMQADDLDAPDKMPYAQKVAKIFGWKWEVIKPEFSVVDYMVAHGIAVDDICSQNHELTKKAFLDLFERYREKHNKKLVFLGLRGQESLARMWNRKTHGVLYHHKADDMWIATPLAYWDVWDIWAYHVLNGIPIRPFYLKGDPAKLRCAWLIPPESVAKHGGVRWLKQTHPGIYNRLVKMFPELKEFV